MTPYLTQSLTAGRVSMYFRTLSAMLSGSSPRLRFAIAGGDAVAAL